MREFKVGSWASFTNESGNRENGILKKIIPLSNGQTDFERYIYQVLSTGQPIEKRSEAIGAAALTEELILALGFEKADDATYKKGEWSLRGSTFDPTAMWPFQTTITSNLPGVANPFPSKPPVPRETIPSTPLTLTNGREEYKVLEVHVVQNIMGAH